jgi:hypothetical protein
MEGSIPKNRFNKLRPSYIFALITIAAGAGGYGYHLYRLARDSQIDKPQPQVERLVKDFRLFQSGAALLERRPSAIKTAT